LGETSRIVARKEQIVGAVRAAMERDARVNLHRYPVRVDFHEGAVILEGEVESVATKKLSLEHAASVDGVRGVVDRLRVMPTARRGDGAIRDSVCGFLLRSSELRNCALRVEVKGRLETLREAPADAGGAIDVAVASGVITLEGTVISLSHKRVAGVLGWWTPGCRDVVNSLDVQPPEDDTDAEVLDALRLVLEMDPLVPHADQLTAKCENYVVTLEGTVKVRQERQQAELDAWALFAVDRVVNRIQVAA
jgi:osmotically-inducible protein OsmY